MQWLRNVFLVYLDDWEKTVNERPGYSKEEKSRMLLSPATRLGLRMTGTMQSCCSHIYGILIPSFIQSTPSLSWWSMSSHCLMWKCSSAKESHRIHLRTFSDVSVSGVALMTTPMCTSFKKTCKLYELQGHLLKVLWGAIVGAPMWLNWMSYLRKRATLCQSDPGIASDICTMSNNCKLLLLNNTTFSTSVSRTPAPLPTYPLFSPQLVPFGTLSCNNAPSISL